MTSRRCALFLSVFLCVQTSNVGHAQQLAEAKPLAADEVAIIAVTDSVSSQEVATYYADRRGIPRSRICWIDVAPGKNLSRAEWDSKIRPTIRNWLLRQKLENQVRCLVTVWDVPLKIERHTADLARRRAFLEADRRARVREVRKAIDDMRSIASHAAVKSVEPIEAEDSFDALQRAVGAEFAAVQKRSVILLPEQRQKAAALLKEALRRSDGMQAIAASSSRGDTPEAKQKIAEQLALAKGRLLGLQDAVNALAQLPDTVERDEQLLSVVATANGALGAIRWLDGQISLLEKNETYSSFDSELSLLFWIPYPLMRWQANLLHHQYDESPLRQRRHTLMVSRLEAPTVALAKRLVDNAISVEKEGLTGKLYLDARGLASEPDETKPGSYADYDQTLRDLAELIQKHTTLESTLNNEAALFQEGDCPDTGLYCGWYSLGNYVPAFKFHPGAVAYHMASSEAYTLRQADSKVWCKRMLEEGVCATLGPVYEPYLAAFPRPDEFFVMLLSGKYSLVECYYRTKPFNSWVMTLVGDPLYNPFRKSPAIKPGDLPAKYQKILGVQVP